MATKPKTTAAPVGRRERKRQSMRDLLAGTSFRLFEAMGYEGVTMERIAEETDVARGTLYKHFPVKEALVAYQFRKEIEEGMGAVHARIERQASFSARMKFLLTASAEWAKSRRAYMPYYIRFRWMTANLGQQPATEDPYSSGTYGILVGLFREAQAAGELRTDLTPERLALTFEMMLTGAIMLWLNHPEVDLQRQYEFELEVLLKGAAKAPAAGSKRASRKTRQ
jgi:AcrR family transcriptional regulator